MNPTVIRRQIREKTSKELTDALLIVKDVLVAWRPSRQGTEPAPQYRPMQTAATERSTAQVDRRNKPPLEPHPVREDRLVQGWNPVDRSDHRKSEPPRQNDHPTLVILS